MSSKQLNVETKINNIWFPNQVEPDPEVNRSLYIQYWKQEKRRCLEGFTLADGKVYIPGWLYFHTVYWVIELDKEITNHVTGKKSSVKTKGTPVLRDIEWMVANDFLRCEEEQKIYMLIGGRGFGKSMMASSFIGQIYTFLPDSECLITAGNHPDIAKLAEKIDMGLSSIHPVLQKPRIKNNWKVEVRAGYVDTDTGFNKGSNSRIIARNYDDGNNSMATNGTRPKRQILDEVGKVPGLIKCVLDSMPSWMNDYGFFSVPMLTGTGGDMEVGEEAGRIFNNPKLYNVMECDDIWEGKGKIGRFIPITQGRNEYKDDWSLFRYLKEKVKGYENLEYHPDLDIIIKVSDEERCLREFVEPRRTLALKSSTSNEIVKEKAYYPIVPSECFLTISSNDFPVEACKEQLAWINKEGFKPQNIELYVDVEGIIRHKHTDKLPVTDFPVLSSTDKTGVIQMLEPPVDNAPFGLYVAGIDPYKVGESDWSDSVGVCVIWKRMTSDMSEPYQNMPVAWYAGRPKDIHTWYENVRLLLKWYNASAMCENADYGFIQYMISKNEVRYMAEGLSFLKEISPNTKHKGTHGLPPTPPMIKHWNGTLVTYASEEIVRERDDKGIATKVHLGVRRIMDVMTLEEMIKFNKDKGNFDRVRAYGIAAAYAQQLDAILPPAVIQKKEVKKEKIIKSPFIGSNISIGKVKSPFLGNNKLW